MIDSHCHLEFNDFDGDREKVIKTAKNRIEGIVNSSAEIKLAQKVLDIHKNHPNFIFPSLGLHPKRVAAASNGELEEFKEIIRKNEEDIVAIGEVGLDYYHLKKEDKREKCRNVFDDFVSLSNSLDLPIVVHSRNSLNDALDILEKKEGNVIIHCFAGDMDDLEECLDRDYYLSFGGIIFRAEEKYKTLLKETPLDNLLLETDAPFLAKRKEDRSEPWFIREVADEIARIKDLEFSEVWKQAGENAKEVFNLSKRL